jgi:hypothetical protein
MGKAGGMMRRRHGHSDQDVTFALTGAARLVELHGAPMVGIFEGMERVSQSRRRQQLALERAAHVNAVVRHVGLKDFPRAWQGEVPQ